MTERTREQLFIDEGLDVFTARLAAVASYLSPSERTQEQQEAVKKASDAIAANCRKLAQDEASTKDLSRPGADYSPTTHNESQGLKPS